MRHCCLSVFQEHLGDKLLKNFLDDDMSDEPILPSPNQLKHKILIKNKKNVEPDTPLPTKQKVGVECLDLFKLCI